MWVIQRWFLKQISIVKEFPTLVGEFASGGLFETGMTGACLLTLVFEDMLLTLPRRRCAKCARFVFSSALRLAGSQLVASIFIDVRTFRFTYVLLQSLQWRSSTSLWDLVLGSMMDPRVVRKILPFGVQDLCGADLLFWLRISSEQLFLENSNSLFPISRKWWLTIFQFGKIVTHYFRFGKIVTHYFRFPKNGDSLFSGFLKNGDSLFSGFAHFCG